VRKLLVGNKALGELRCIFKAQKNNRGGGRAGMARRAVTVAAGFSRP
jgi:hypothetical protein